MNEVIGYAFIIAGLLSGLLGSIGLIRLPDVYSRLQATTKCVTLGTVSILLGVVILKGFTATGIKALLCIAFLVLTAPVIGHALSVAAHKSGAKLWEKSVCDKYREDKEGL